MDTGVNFDPQMIFDHPDPYPMFAMMRASMPVMRVEFMNRIAYSVAKYDDCLAVLKDADTYQIMDPEELGLTMTLPLGKHSGRHAFRRACTEAGLQLTEDELAVAFARFKTLADDGEDVTLNDAFEEVAA